MSLSTSETEALGRFLNFSQLQKLKTSYIPYVCSLISTCFNIVLPDSQKARSGQMAESL